MMTHVADFMEAVAGLATSACWAGEMLVASNSVVQARMTIIAEAVRRPASADFEELGRMLPEKFSAFSKANQACAQQWSAMVLDTYDNAHHFGLALLNGRPMSVSDLARLAERSTANVTRTLTRVMNIGGLALAPIHEQATANALRLATT